MSKKSCKGCYFYGDCVGRKICGGYTPLSEDGEDFETRLTIRKGREEFRAEWNEYITYINDPGTYETPYEKIKIDRGE